MASPADYLSIAVQAGNVESNKRRTNIMEARQNALNEGYDAMFNKEFAEHKRVLAVARTGKDEGKIDAAAQDYALLLNIKDDPDARRGYMEINMKNEFSRQAQQAYQRERNALIAQSQAHQAQIGLLQLQNRETQDFYSNVMRTTNNSAEALVLAESALEAKQFALGTDDPNERSAAFERYADLKKDIATIAGKREDEAQKQKLELKRTTGYSAELFEKMPLSTQAYAENIYEWTGERADLRVLNPGKGWFPGGEPGAFPFGGGEAGDRLYDKDTALERGFSEKAWNNAKRIVRQQLKNRKTKVNGKGKPPKDYPDAKWSEADKVWITTIDGVEYAVTEEE